MSSPENPLYKEQPRPEASQTGLTAGPTPEPTFPPSTLNAGLEERFPVWSFVDLGLVLAVLVGSMFASQLLALLVATALPAFHGLKLEQIATSPIVVISSMAAGYLLTLAFVYRMLTSHYGVGFLDGLHWRWPSLRWPVYLVGGAVLSLVIQGASAFLPIPKDLPIDNYFKSATGAWTMALFGTFVAPFVEEVLFRGLLFPVLARKVGSAVAVFVTGAAFAMVHASQLGRAWSPVLMLLVVGITLTLIRYWARSLAASVLVHTAYNATIFTIVIWQTHWFQRLDKLQ